MRNIPMDLLRSFVTVFEMGGFTVAAAATATARPSWGGLTLGDAFADFFQQHYQRMSADEIRNTIERIQRKAQRRYGVDITVANTPPLAVIGGIIADKVVVPRTGQVNLSLTVLAGDDADLTYDWQEDPERYPDLAGTADRSPFLPFASALLCFTL